MTATLVGATGPERGHGLLPCDHGRRAGRLDERARRLSHEELGVAHQLAAEGHHVRSASERPGRGPTADLVVCGRAVEVKSFLTAADRPAGPPAAASVCNKLLKATHQADLAVLWARGSGLDEGAARAGLRLFAQRQGWSRMASVRVLGDGFDLTWDAPLHRARDAWRGAPRDQGLGR